MGIVGDGELPVRSQTNDAQGVVQPLVTVIVTLYNYELYLEDCLVGIAAQTYSLFECLIIDDASTDLSVEVAKRFIERHGLQNHFRILQHEKNLGQLAAFHTGLAEARGEFVAFVDADDIWHSHFLDEHIKVHLSFQPVAFTSSNQFQINGKGELIAGQHTDHRAGGRYIHVKPTFVFANWWIWATTSSMVFRRATLEVVMTDSFEPFRRCADNYICHFSHLLGGSLLIPQCLGYYRRHSLNNFSTNRIVGGNAQPTGDMSRHPHHTATRTAIREKLISNIDNFQALLGGNGLSKVLASVLTQREAIALAMEWSTARKWKTASLYTVLTLLIKNIAFRWIWRIRRMVLLPHRQKFIVLDPHGGLLPEMGDACRD